MPFVTDLQGLSENERIEAIGRSVTEIPASSADKPLMNGFIVESDAKADRYIQKLLRLYPGVRIVDRGPGPVKGTILVRIAGPLP
jgi:hypothetical protein